MKLNRLPALACILLLVLAPIAAQSPESARRQRVVVRPAPGWVHVEGETFPDRIVLKFVEGIRVRLVGGELRALEGHDLSRIVAALEDAEVSRLFTRAVEGLDAERARLQPNVPEDEPPLADLNNYYRITTSGAAQTTRLVNALNRLELVETAYAEWIPVPADGDIPPATPSFEARQGYLAAAPSGFAYRSIMSVVGARFPDNQMAHLEGSWEIGHEDHDLLASNYLGLPPGGGYEGPSWKPHGTSCVGIMAARHNGFGVSGFGSATPRIYLASLVNGSANIISLATAQLGPGDVMSSSYVYLGSVGGDLVSFPVDFAQAGFDAVRRAAAAGIMYTFAVGNTDDRLNDQTKFGTRYLPRSPSSNGFIIGATDAGSLNRASFSSYGSRVDANGWGSSVTTLGYGDLFEAGSDDRQDYTYTFGGTSAAAPMVAGAIASLVGAVREQNGQILTPDQVRTALDTTGTQINGPRNIGTRPNLEQLFALFGLPDGLLVPQQGRVGGSFTFAISGNANEPFGLWLSFDRGNTPTPWNRPILIDLNQAFALAVGSLPGSGQLSVVVPLPNDPSLRGADGFLQAGISRAGSVHITNSAELLIF